MIRIFKDAYKINLVITIAFFSSIVVVIFLLFRLPSQLLIPNGFEAFAATYAAVAISFLLGIIAVMRGLQYKRELIVYRERKDERTQEQRDADENKSSITMDEVTKALNSSSSNNLIQDSLQVICNQLAVGQGAFYTNKESNSKKLTELTNGYALTVNENQKVQFELGEGLIGQAAATGQMLYLDEVPEGYIKIISGLGSASPRYLLITSAKAKGQVVGVIELASFNPFTDDQRKFVEQAAKLIAEKLEIKNS